MALQFHGVRFQRRGFEMEASFRISAPIAALVGPSGAGKTTLLELAAGLLRPLMGSVTLHDAVLSDAATAAWTPPHARRIGYLPQDLLLFPHLSIRRNLTFGLRKAGASPGYDRVIDALELRGLEDRRPDTLSGGQRQRVALGRALLAGPKLLLLDEPFNRLDGELKAQAAGLVRRVAEEFAVPVLYVTHDPAEVVALAEEVVRVEGGRVTPP
jgi:molybdate transport system ATP-binding protein